MHNPIKSSSNISGRSIGISNQKNEMSVNSRSPNGTRAPSPSVNCSPILEISSIKLNELKGFINDTQQLLPIPSMSFSQC